MKESLLFLLVEQIVSYKEMQPSSSKWDEKLSVSSWDRGRSLKADCFPSLRRLRQTLVYILLSILGAVYTHTQKKQLETREIRDRERQRESERSERMKGFRIIHGSHNTDKQTLIHMICTLSIRIKDPSTEFQGHWGHEWRRKCVLWSLSLHTHTHTHIYIEVGGCFLRICGLCPKLGVWISDTIAECLENGFSPHTRSTTDIHITWKEIRFRNFPKQSLWAPCRLRNVLYVTLYHAALHCHKILTIRGKDGIDCFCCHVVLIYFLKKIKEVTPERRSYAQVVIVLHSLVVA